MLLDWSQDDLSERSLVSVSTIRNFEQGKRATYPANLAALRRAFEDAGIEFMPGGCRLVR